MKEFHHREAYSFLDILGLIGGLTRALTTIGGIFFLIYSKNSLIMEIASELFVLKPEEAKIFDNSKKVESYEAYLNRRSDVS